MGILNNFFGPSKDEIWSQIANDIGGKYIDAGFWKKDVLIYKHKVQVNSNDLHQITCSLY